MSSAAGVRALGRDFATGPVRPNRSGASVGTRAATGRRGGTPASTAASSDRASSASVCGSIEGPGRAFRARSRTVSRVSNEVPRRAKARPWTAVEKTAWAGGSSEAKASFQACEAGPQWEDEMATRRPPGGSMEAAERMCRRSTWRRVRPMPGLAEKGGFIRTTPGRRSGSRSAIDSALWRVPSWRLATVTTGLAPGGGAGSVSSLVTAKRGCRKRSRTVPSVTSSEPGGDSL